MQLIYSYRHLQINSGRFLILNFVITNAFLGVGLYYSMEIFVPNIFRAFAIANPSQPFSILTPLILATVVLPFVAMRSAALKHHDDNEYCLEVKNDVEQVEKSKRTLNILSPTKLGHAQEKDDSLNSERRMINFKILSII